jgi:hypothetical protein
MEMNTYSLMMGVQMVQYFKKTLVRSFQSKASKFVDLNEFTLNELYTVIPSMKYSAKGHFKRQGT